MRYAARPGIGFQEDIHIYKSNNLTTCLLNKVSAAQVAPYGDYFDLRGLDVDITHHLAQCGMASLFIAA